MRRHPNVGAAEKPGLFLKNTTITNNKANQDEGYGAGVLAMKMKSPAAAEIRDCTIKKNSAAVGGGVASYGNFTSLTIDGCTITGNKASNYGGGFAAESNSGEGAGTTITNTKLCNNIADKAASDVYLNGSVAKLSAAKDMDELYLGKPDDVTNKKIDGWYLDNEDSRYTTQAKEQRNEYADYASIGSDGKVCLVTAAKPSLVKITFANEDGTTIYSEDWYEIGTKADQITVPLLRNRPTTSTTTCSIHGTPRSKMSRVTLFTRLNSKKSSRNSALSTRSAALLPTNSCQARF